MDMDMDMDVDMDMDMDFMCLGWGGRCQSEQGACLFAEASGQDNYGLEMGLGDEKDGDWLGRTGPQPTATLAVTSCVHVNCTWSGRRGTKPTRGHA